jgi:hypothetical protein
MLTLENTSGRELAVLSLLQAFEIIFETKI